MMERKTQHAFGDGSVQNIWTIGNLDEMLLGMGVSSAGLFDLTHICACVSASCSCNPAWVFVDIMKKEESTLHMLIEKKNFLTQILDLSNKVILAGHSSEF